MANDKDKLFEKIYFLWKGESEKRNQSIDWYCERYHADVEEFRKWYQGINHSVKALADIRRVDNSLSRKRWSADLASLKHRNKKAEAAEEAICRKTESIVQRIRMKLLELKIQLHQAPETISALLKDAITYLDNAWKEVFAYRQNGDFTIDNMAAERAIKPVTNQRKNSLFQCSESGARNAATFNTFIQTCKQMGVPFMSYFKKVMNELKNGRTDYQNLLPATIQL